MNQRILPQLRKDSDQDIYLILEFMNKKDESRGNNIFVERKKLNFSTTLAGTHKKEHKK